MARKKKTTKPKAKAAELRVNFKNASPTKTRRNLGIEMDRGELSLDNVDALLINASLECEIKCDPNAQKDAQGQQTFEAGDVLELAFTADVANVTVTADVYRFTLSLPLDTVEANSIERFRYRKGQLICSRVGQAALPPEESGDQAAA